MAPVRQQHINAHITTTSVQIELVMQLQSENDEMRGRDGRQVNALLFLDQQKTKKKNQKKNNK